MRRTLEQISDYRIRHGEAVAIGIALDVIYSRNMGFLDALSSERILSLLDRLGFELFANEHLHEDSDGNLVVLKGLEEFREHLGGQLTITLLQGVGRGFEVHEMDSSVVLASIRDLHERQTHGSRRCRPRLSSDGSPRARHLHPFDTLRLPEPSAVSHVTWRAAKSSFPPHFDFRHAAAGLSSVRKHDAQFWRSYFREGHCVHHVASGIHR